MDLEKGRVVAVKGDIVEVEFYRNFPFIKEILILEKDPSVFLEVYKSSKKNCFYCFCLSDPSKISRGDRVERTRKFFEIPVGKELLGRVIDIFGNPLDGEPKIETKEKKEIWGSPPPYQEIVRGKEIIETGIKVIDFFVPLIKGEELGIFGGAGVGKTVLLLELMHNLCFLKKEYAIFAGIGERIREGHELYEILKNTNILPRISLIFGQMNEPAPIRFKVGFVAATLAEYFRDELKKNVFVFIDNIYRFLQAGNEISVMLEEIPSEDGYQATLYSEISSLEERLVSTKNGTITSIQAVYVPADDITDSGVQAILPYFDSVIILSRDVYQEGRFPAVDILNSSSSAINPSILGKEHYELLIEAKRILEQYKNLEQIVTIIGESELSLENRKIYHRARKILNFMTQNFFTTQEQTGLTGKYISKSETIEGVKAILEGRYDNLPDEAFLFLGSLKDLKL
jgi:F-type H+-transporting ATPase subunit beta